MAMWRLVGPATLLGPRLASPCGGGTGNARCSPRRYPRLRPPSGRVRDSLGTAGCCGPGVRCASPGGSPCRWRTGLSMVHGFSVYWPGCPAAPAVPRTATASRTPTTAVAVSGIVYGPWKPDMAAWGADAAPISNAAKPAQRRQAWHPRAVRTLSTAAASPAAASPAVGAGCRAAARTRPHRVRSSTAAVSSITAIRCQPGLGLAAGAAFSGSGDVPGHAVDHQYAIASCSSRCRRNASSA